MSKRIVIVVFINCLILIVGFIYQDPEKKIAFCIHRLPFFVVLFESVSCETLRA